jgi:hypothetical protein
MASFATDFHATPEEQTVLVGKWLSEYPVVATAEAFPPSRTFPLTRENFREMLAQPSVREVLFTESSVLCRAASIYQILDEHPGGLCLHVQHIGPRGLKQSRLSTMHTNPMWQKMNRELKKMTTAGAELVWESGSTRYDRNARFTAGAKALAASGVPLRQFGQSDFIYLPK